MWRGRCRVRSGRASGREGSGGCSAFAPAPLESSRLRGAGGGLCVILCRGLPLVLALYLHAVRHTVVSGPPPLRPHLPSRPDVHPRPRRRSAAHVCTAHTRLCLVFALALDLTAAIQRDGRDQHLATVKGSRLTGCCASLLGRELDSAYATGGTYEVAAGSAAAGAALVSSIGADVPLAGRLR